MPVPELHRGKIAKHPRVISVRALTRDDLACLKEKRAGPPKVQQYRETHHRVARLIAAGLRPGEVARMTGYAPNRIHQLRSDPAFEQLVAEYKDKVDMAYVESLDEFMETSTSNMLRAERMIEAHLDKAEDEDELIPLKTLLSITADRADRFGYGKKSTQTNEVYNFAEMMAQIAQRSGKSNVIDSKPVVESPPTQPPAQSATGGFRRRV